MQKQVTYKTRRESYEVISNKLNAQEQKVYVAVKSLGLNNFVSIMNHYNMDRDSCKRALSDLSREENYDPETKSYVKNKKKVLISDSTVINPNSGKKIAKYRAMTSDELRRFHCLDQQTIF